MSEQFIGNVDYQHPGFHASCVGPAVATFAFVIDGQGIPTWEFNIAFEFDDCAPRFGLLYQINSDDLDEASFITRTGGHGSVVGDHLSFTQVVGEETVSFEGAVGP